MNKPFLVSWSERSLYNAKTIKAYLKDHFSDKEVKKFERMLADFERTITYFPEIYPLTKQANGIRKAVLSKRLIAYYLFENEKIIIVALQDSRQLFKS